MLIETFGQRKCRQVGGVADRGLVHERDEKPADRGERQRPAEGLLPGTFVFEEFREPGDRGDHFHAHADERRAAEKDEHPEFGAEPGEDGAEGVNEDAADHDAFAAEAIDEDAAEQPEDAAA